jgi:hypothetical protein
VWGTVKLCSMDEPQGIYRGEVLAIMGVLADIYADTSYIRAILDEEDEDDDEAEEMDS